MQCYFMMLHVWVLHKRLITEGRAGKFIDKKMFELCWHLVQQWMLLKKIPESAWVSLIITGKFCDVNVLQSVRMYLCPTGIRLPRH